jgi:hypothetical protein
VQLFDGLLFCSASKACAESDECMKEVAAADMAVVYPMCEALALHHQAYRYVLLTFMLLYSSQLYEHAL